MRPRVRDNGQHDGHCETEMLHSLVAADSSISNRRMCRVEIALTHSKQTIGAHATRHKTVRSKAPLPTRLPIAFLRNALCTALAMLLGAAATLAGPRPSKALTVERIYGAPSLSGSL